MGKEGDMGVHWKIQTKKHYTYMVQFMYMYMYSVHVNVWPI